MKKPKYERSEIIMAALVLVALAAAIITGVNLISGKRAAQKAATAKASPTPTLVINTPTPSPTQEAEPASVGPKANSGGFMTQTGTSLNLIFNWYAEEAGDEVTVYVDVLLDCSTLHTASRVSGITIGVGSKTVILDSAEVNTPQGPNTVTLASTHFNVPASDFSSGSCDAYATWRFGGLYGGQAIPELTTTGAITLE